jgi:hypothetical protein
MIPCFHKDFWEIKVLIQNRNQIGVCSNKNVLKIQVISQKGDNTPIKEKHEINPNTIRCLQKLSFSCMNNEKHFAYSHERKQSLPKRIATVSGLFPKITYISFQNKNKK